MSTKIEWTHRTWNPITGCSRISEGCKHCYAERMAQRLKGRCGYPEDNPFAITYHHNKLRAPYHWRKPQMILVCSMGDLFHEKISFNFIDIIMGVILDNQRHIFQVLTKRPARAFHYFESRSEIIENLWFGVTAENQIGANVRIPFLANIPARLKFASFEPLLEDIRLDNLIQYLDWVIVGGETGPGARPMEFCWAANLFHCAQENYVPMFFKHWGEYNADGERVGKKRSGRLIFGAEWNDFPLGVNTISLDTRDYGVYENVQQSV